MALTTYTLLFRPTDEWMTKPLQLATPGNPAMQQTRERQTVFPHGAGSRVIDALAHLYQEHGQPVLVFESSQAAQRATARLFGQADPDDVFAVDYCRGFRVNTTGHFPQVPGTWSRMREEPYVNVVGRMSVPTRRLEPFVVKEILLRLGVRNIVMQPLGAHFEGGDFDYLPAAFETKGSESLLVTGNGENSRTDDAGRQWLGRLFLPDRTLSIPSEHRELELVSEYFHRDLASVFVQDAAGHLVQVLMGKGVFDGEHEIEEKLRTWDIPVTWVPEHLVESCLMNLSVRRGLLISLQDNQEFTELIKTHLMPGITFATLSPEFQEDTAAFTALQGGANCVSGSFVAEAETIRCAADEMESMMSYLHSEALETYLMSVAEEIGLKEAYERASHRIA